VKGNVGVLSKVPATPTHSCAGAKHRYRSREKPPRLLATTFAAVTAAVALANLATLVLEFARSAQTSAVPAVIMSLYDDGLAFHNTARAARRHCGRRKRESAAARDKSRSKDNAPHRSPPWLTSERLSVPGSSDEQ
jgi:hypothetical protein